MSGSPQWLIDLADVDQVATAGGKAFNLARIGRLGIPTPGGAVIPDSVFQRHLTRAGVTGDIEQLFARLDELPEPGIETASTNIRERIAVAELDPALARTLALAGALQGRVLAVRSSAVGEDTARMSFAGQLESFLNVAGTVGLETAIKATWGSLFSPRVLRYARHHKVRVGHMGVIIQPQVDARLSGVLFTRDPANRHVDSMLAEYCAGLGEQVVGGLITPSRLRIDRDDLTLSLEYAADASTNLDDESTQAIKDIARMGLALEREYGAPQDIEWCIDRDNRVVIVQARPASQVARVAAKVLVHWTNANIAENYPDPVSPFLFSIVRPGYSAYFRNLGLGFGISRRRIQAMAAPLEDIVGLQGGRLYYNLTNIHALLQMMPAGRRLVESFNLFVGAENIPAPPEMPLGVLARTLETARIFGAILWQYLFIQGRVRRFERRVDKFASGTQPHQLAQKTAAALLMDMKGFLTIRLTQWNDAALADTAAMVCYGLLKAQLARGLAASDHAGIHNDLLKGLPNLASAEPVTRLWALSRQIANDAELRTLLSSESAEQILNSLSGERCATFRHAFEDYLEKWGFRSSGELMLTAPTPQEDPRPLLRLLQAYVRASGTSPEELSRVQLREREAVTAKVAAQLSPARWWRWVPLASRASRFRILLAATQGAIKLRERARMKQALLYTRLRHIALNLGDRLVERELIGQREDIFLLTTAEARDIVADGATDLTNLIECRRRALQSFQAQQPPDRLALREGERWIPAAAAARDMNAEEPGRVLYGNGACGGSALGAAAVVLDVANADRLQAGQILVTRQTDPGWAAVFFLVRGLVIERGGMLSHGAIIAREYGIPAVVGVPGATRLIQNGDSVRVDGDQGLVELVDH